ncbi:hypothetical protein ACFL6C_09985 [Myxococcota bacterium]
MQNIEKEPDARHRSYVCDPPLGFVPNGRFVLAVFEYDSEPQWVRVVTAYEPDSERYWRFYEKKKNIS